MKNILRDFVTAVTVIGLAVSCNTPAEPAEKEQTPQGVVIDEAKVAAFVETREYGVYGSDVSAVFVMDKLQHEMVYNTRARRFVIQDDYQKSLLTVTLSSAEESSQYSVSLASTAEGVANGTFTMKMVKSEEDTAWLWDLENRLGVVIMFQ